MYFYFSPLENSDVTLHIAGVCTLVKLEWVNVVRPEAAILPKGLANEGLHHANDGFPQFREQFVVLANDVAGYPRIQAAPETEIVC